jgi:SAM-dependent methyltransferase
VVEPDVPGGFSAMAEVYVDLTPQARRLLALARLRPGERVLDAGCGPGTATVLAADLVGPEGSVVGVDLADALLDRARAATAGLANVEIRAMDATDLAWGDGTFDAVVASSVVQFTGPASLREWQRVTRPGGRVACSLPWGPDLWSTLCRRYVEHTSEPYRSFATRRLAAAERRPDPEQARERFGFAAVETDGETLVERFASPEAAWASFGTHGSSLFLEALTPEARARMEADFVAALSTTGRPELRTECLYWCFTVAG